MGGGGVRREEPPPILSPFCPQTETLWAPSPRCLRACPLATTTHRRTVTSLDTMTCLQYGTPRHPHSGARTADGSGWHAGTSIPVLCCLRLGTEPAVPCQEQGEARQTLNMNVYERK